LFGCVVFVFFLSRLVSKATKTLDKKPKKIYVHLAFFSFSFPNSCVVFVLFVLFFDFAVE